MSMHVAKQIKATQGASATYHEGNTASEPSWKYWILMWTRAYPCTEQGRAERCATEWSVREHRLFEQLPRTWLRMPFRARLRAFMPSLLRSFASLRPRGRANPNSLSTSSQYRSKYTWRIHSKINLKSIQNRWKSVLGAMLAQDDTSLEQFWPRMIPRFEFLLIV